VPPVPNRPRPYDDNFGETGVLSYRYRGNDPQHRDNAGLRLAMERQTPLIYFHGIVPGLYEPAWPVYVVGDDPTQLTFSVMVDDEVIPMTSFQVHDPAAVDAKRRYIIAVVQRRLHQKGFRERVLQAYQRCCAVCHLKHAELLEAAHILPDGHPQGEPTVRNGLALCKLHHAAFDSYMLGITPDLTIDIRQDLLEEIDGPMLVRGLQGFQGRGIRTPRSPLLKPHRDFLAERYEIFRRAG
jgi:putative restriction endonuclease